MVNYQNGKIYRISAGDLTYYGSTTQKLCVRMGRHRDQYRQGTGCSSTMVLQQDPQAKIILVETYPCNTKEELTAREQYWIDNNPCVNKQSAHTGISPDSNDYHKEYYILRGLGEKHTCPCGGCYTTAGRKRHLTTNRHTKWATAHDPPRVI